MTGPWQPLWQGHWLAGKDTNLLQEACLRVCLLVVGKYVDTEELGKGLM